MKWVNEAPLACVVNVVRQVQLCGMRSLSHQLPAS